MPALIEFTVITGAFLSVTIVSNTSMSDEMLLSFTQTICKPSYFTSSSSEVLNVYSNVLLLSTRLNSLLTSSCTAESFTNLTFTLLASFS